MTKDQIIAAQKIGLAILEVIEEAGELGAPSGPMYAALNANGCSLSQYQSLMETLQRRGFVNLQDHCYTLTPAGKTFMVDLKRTLAKVEAAQACQI